MNSHTTKSYLRKQFLDLRKKLPWGYKMIATHTASDHFFKHINLADIDSVACFLSMRDEIGIRPLFKKLEKRQIITALPVIMDQENILAFHRWSWGDPIKKHHTITVFEPFSDKKTLIIPDIIVVPFLAFDMKGYRLGYGKGFYDQTIRSLKDKGHHVYCIGYGFESQKVDSLPYDPHDQPLDCVITEKNCYHFTTQA